MESDLLPILRSFAAMANRRTELISLQRPLVVVVDTNFMFSAALMKLRTRAGIRTAFEEVSDSGAIVFLGPDAIDLEVTENAIEVTKGDAEKARKLIAVYQMDLRQRLNLLRPVATDSPAIKILRSRDPKDLPFARVYEQFAADAILTDDHHFHGLGYRIIKGRAGPDAMVALRDYARNKAAELGPVSGATIVGAVGFVAVEETAAAVARLPWWAHLLLLFGAGMLVFTETGKSITSSVKDKAVDAFGPMVGEAAAGYQQAKAAAGKVHERALNAIPVGPRVPANLASALLDVLSRSALPVAEKELKVGLARVGYARIVTDQNMRSKLRKCGAFVEVTPGKWSLWSNASPRPENDEGPVVDATCSTSGNTMPHPKPTRPLGSWSA